MRIAGADRHRLTLRQRPYQVLDQSKEARLTRAGSRWIRSSVPLGTMGLGGLGAEVLEADEQDHDTKGGLDTSKDGRKPKRCNMLKPEGHTVTE